MTAPRAQTELELDAIEAHYGPCKMAETGTCLDCPADPRVVDAVRELRRLREENARYDLLLNKACRQLSKLTGEPWPPLPAPPEVKNV